MMQWDYLLWVFEILWRCHPEEVMILVRHEENTAVNLGAKGDRGDGQEE